MMRQWGWCIGFFDVLSWNFPEPKVYRDGFLEQNRQVSLDNLLQHCLDVILEPQIDLEVIDDEKLCVMIQC